jgi:hypothetical protein
MKALLSVFAAVATLTASPAFAEAAKPVDTGGTDTAIHRAAPLPAPAREQKIDATTGMSETGRGGGCRDIVVRTQQPGGTTMIRKLIRCD